MNTILFKNKNLKYIMEEFQRNGISILIDKDSNESYEVFNDRCKFIISQKDTNIKFNELIKYSKIYTNIKYMKCVYNSDTVKIIENLKKNLS